MPEGVLALALPLLLAATPPTWTEADALSAFERSSPALVDARATEASAAAGVRQAGLRPNPSLSVGASNFPVATPRDGPSIERSLAASVELDQPFELGGKRGRRLAVARGGLAEATLGRVDALRTARADLRRAYWQAVRAREGRAMAEAVERRMGETVRIMRARFESQDVSALDVDKIELEAAQQENDLADAKATERTAREQLLRLVGPGAPPDVVLEGALAAAAPPFEAARLEARARAARPDLAEARRRVATAEAAVALAEAAAVPDVTVGLGYSRSAALLSGDAPQALALTLSLPLPLFGRNQGEIEKARVEAARARLAADALDAQVGREVESALARYAAAAEKVTRYDGGALARAERALTIAEKTYRAGDRSLLEFLEAERTWIAVRGDYLDTQYELRAARIELEAAVGADPTEAT